MKKCKKNVFGMEMKNLQDTKKGGTKFRLFRYMQTAD